MSWATIIASLFWGAAAVTVVAWYLLRDSRASPHRNHPERRSFPRPKLGFHASLKMEMGDGTTKTLPVRGYNLTKYGANVVSNCQLPPGAVVLINLPDYNLMGVGHVLHCTPRKLKYCIGMEFKNPLMRSQVGTWTVQIVN